jgi:hypothetical protein
MTASFASSASSAGSSRLMEPSAPEAPRNGERSDCLLSAHVSAQPGSTPGEHHRMINRWFAQSLSLVAPSKSPADAC